MQLALNCILPIDQLHHYHLLSTSRIAPIDTASGVQYRATHATKFSTMVEGCSQNQETPKTDPWYQICQGLNWYMQCERERVVDGRVSEVIQRWLSSKHRGYIMAISGLSNSLHSTNILLQLGYGAYGVYEGDDLIVSGAGANYKYYYWRIVNRKFIVRLAIFI